MSETASINIDPAVVSINAKLGRPLRVLHIGNIANNAYNNARIQRQYGIEADVICYDYYHIMSCPEWEDGTFTGEVGGNFPDWFATSLKGWSRPEWFVQGPADLCLQYLRARHLKMGLTQRLIRSYMAVHYWRILDDFAALEGRKRPPAPRHMRWTAWLVETMGLPNAINHDAAAMARLGAWRSANDTQSPDCNNNAGSVAAFPGAEPVENAETSSPLRKVFLGRSRAIVRQAIIDKKKRVFDRLVIPLMLNNRFANANIRLWILYRRCIGRPSLSPQELDLFLKSKLMTNSHQNVRGAAVSVIDHGHPPNTISIPAKVFYFARSLLAHISTMLVSSMVRLRRRLVGPIRTALERRGDQIKARFGRIQSTEDREARIPIYLERRKQFIAAAADADASVQDELKIYTEYMPLRFFDMMKTYDVIQGYSIDGFIPYMNGLTNFAAYEHGTIRDLPWELSLSGIIAAKVYREAPLVFVTNSDVLPSVDRLGLASNRVVYLPHAFDDAKLRAFRDANPDLQPPPGPVIFFSPTRHHWKDKSGSWTKGNDVFLHAAGLLAREGYDFRLVLVEWGNEVPESRELVENLSLTDKVIWVPTMQKRELWTRYCTSHAVIDQFTLPALGGVGFETMALGRRLITALDEAQTIRFFGHAPPCLIAQTVATCRDRMREVILDPGDEAGRGAAARQWMIDYHSAQRIVSLQAKAYSKLLAETSETPSAQPC